MEIMSNKQIVHQEVTAEQKKQDLQRDLAVLDKEQKLGAMSVLPKMAEFETKDREEQIILVLRRHPISNFKWILGAMVLALVPVLAIMFRVVPQNLSVRYQFLVLLMWELLIFGYSLEQFLIWFFNVYIVTNERIVDIDFYNLLYREISDTDLDKIQDVTLRGTGVGAAIFHYGDILVQTAAEKQMFEFYQVPQPELVSKIIRTLIEYNELYEQKH